MTGLGKYEQGLRLEAEGLSGEKIAEKLGYKDAASWYASKAYYKRRQADILERSKPRTDNTPQKAAIMEGVPERVAIGSNKPKPAPTRARGRSPGYLLPGAGVQLTRPVLWGQHKKTRRPRCISQATR